MPSITPAFAGAALPGMLGLPGDRLHQQWTAGDRLDPVIASSR